MQIHFSKRLYQRKCIESAVQAFEQFICLKEITEDEYNFKVELEIKKTEYSESCISGRFKNFSLELSIEELAKNYV